MRKFPSTTELSSEQREIYSANLDKALLIVGPPGTGKTVMAIMRAQRMSQDGDCKIFMWNKTLEAYTKNQTNTHESLKKSVSTLEAHIKQKFISNLHYGMQIWKTNIIKDNKFLTGPDYDYRSDTLFLTDMYKKYGNMCIIMENLIQYVEGNTCV